MLIAHFSTDEVITMENEIRYTPPFLPVYTTKPNLANITPPRDPQPERSPEEQWKNLERKVKQMSGEV